MVSEHYNDFAQTPIGMFPKDWRIAPLKELTHQIIDGTHFTPTYTKTGVPFLRVTDIQTDEIDFANLKYISALEHRQLRQRCSPERGDLLLSKNGTIGIPKLVTWDWEFSIFVSLALIKTKPDKLDVRFLEQFFKSNFLDRQISEKSKQGTVTNLHLEEIREIEIPLPPTKSEQTAIATSLGDADAVIAALEKLIEKKRNIKQGVMQELLKPREGWQKANVYSISDKIIDYRGVTPKKLGMEWGNGEIPALSANNVQMGHIDFERECYAGSIELYKRWMRNGDCEKDDLLLTMEAPLGNVAFIPDNRKYILSQRTVLIRPKKELSKVFLRYLLMTDAFQKKLIENSSGTTATGIQRNKLEKIEISYPEDTETQKQIANILLTMDDEIQLLQEQLLKHRCIKQGMMQQLLTGKMRLI